MPELMSVSLQEFTKQQNALAAGVSNTQASSGVHEHQERQQERQTADVHEKETANEPGTYRQKAPGSEPNLISLHLDALMVLELELKKCQLPNSASSAYAAVKASWTTLHASFCHLCPEQAGGSPRLPITWTFLQFFLTR